MGIRDHFSSLLKNLYACQEATVKTQPNMKQRTVSKLGKEYVKAVYCHPAYLTYMQSTSCEMQRWMNKLELRLPRENQWPQICRWHHSNGRKRRGTKSFLMKLKEESEKVGLKLNIQKMKIMASSPITSWQTDGENVVTVTDYFLGLQNHCRWWLYSQN